MLHTTYWLITIVVIVVSQLGLMTYRGRTVPYALPPDQFPAQSGPPATPTPAPAPAPTPPANDAVVTSIAAVVRAVLALATAIGQLITSLGQSHPDWLGILVLIIAWRFVYDRIRLKK